MIRLVEDPTPDIEVFEYAGPITGPGSYGNGSIAYTINHFMGRKVKHVLLLNSTDGVLYRYERNRNNVGTEGTRGYLVHSVTEDSFTVQLYHEGYSGRVEAYFY